MTPSQTEVRKTEAGVIRVWAIGRPMPEAEAIGNDADRLAGLLGLDAIEPSGAEVIDTRRLADIGLSGYLAEGLGIAADDVRAHAARLDAARGPVLILRSRAFGGRAESLSPDTDLTPLGTFTEAAAKPMKPRFQSAGDAAGSAAGTTGNATAGGSSRRTGGQRLWIALAVLLAAALIFILVGR